ncbi:PREDICTED: uncharacterized protein C2orf42 homolog, partial [Acanthisitta chloris]|uniref:uncharacterized protein C2orf42 homolog n=1 Tax=Acanthisitta chloris TaxID=57068 RepID=UPI0004F0CEF4
LKGTVVPQLVSGPESAARAGGTTAKAKRRKKDMESGHSSSWRQEEQPEEDSCHLLTEETSVPSLLPAGCNQVLDESQVSLSFQDWLASVTERIHQTMHYQFEGRPEPLVFHIPQTFFEALQQRISSGSSKKRLPNSTTAFVRRDALPLGTFSKYTWHITNVLQVKQIFDTPE